MKLFILLLINSFSIFAQNSKVDEKIGTCEQWNELRNNYYKAQQAPSVIELKDRPTCFLAMPKNELDKEENCTDGILFTQFKISEETYWSKATPSYGPLFPEKPSIKKNTWQFQFPNQKGKFTKRSSEELDQFTYSNSPLEFVIESRGGVFIYQKDFTSVSSFKIDDSKKYVYFKFQTTSLQFQKNFEGPYFGYCYN